MVSSTHTDLNTEKTHLMTGPNDAHEVSIQEGYERWAAQYDQDDNALIVIEERLTAPLLAPIRTTHVLDLGTGTGRYAIRLAAQGARVVGLDQSKAMLSIAQRAAERAGVQIQFIQHSLNTVLPNELGNNSFDLIVTALALCHVENLISVASEAYRVLCPGGHILVTDFHPAVIAAGWRTQFVDSGSTYLLPTAHHTRDDYLNALHSAGFHIQIVQEALVREIPENAISRELLDKDGDKPFCLVILASKPAND